MMSTVYISHVPMLVHFKVLKEFVGGYDVLKDYLNKIPPRAFNVKEINKHANIFMYFVYFEQTFRVDGTVTIYFNGKEIALKSLGKIRDNLDKIESVQAGSPMPLKFSIHEFKMLLSDFIDLLKRVDV
jgi:hypothetical protein